MVIANDIDLDTFVIVEKRCPGNYTLIAVMSCMIYSYCWVFVNGKRC